MTGLIVAKGVVHVASALGVARVLSQVLKNNTTIVTGLDKVLVNTGGLVLGSMVTEAAAKHVTAQITAVSDWFKEHQDEVEKVRDEAFKEAGAGYEETSEKK